MAWAVVHWTDELHVVSRVRHLIGTLVTGGGGVVVCRTLVNS